MTAAATRQAPGSRPWSAWIPRDRFHARHNRAFAHASDRQRVLLLVLEFLWKSRPYAFASNADLTDITGWDLRKVQRTLEELQRDGLIHREVITGRTDRVTGRRSITGRIAIVALARLSDQPVATPGPDLDQVLDTIRRDLDRRQPPTVPFDRPLGARQICHPVHDISGAGCTTNLSSALIGNKRGIQEQTTTTREDAGRSSSSLSLLSEPEPERESHPSSELPGEVHAPLSTTELPGEVHASPRTELPGEVHAPRNPPAGAAIGPVSPSPAPVMEPTALAVRPVADGPPAELVAAAAEAIPGASREWARGLLRDCGEYGLSLALLVLAWVKAQGPEKPTRYARVALSNWLTRLRAGELTLEDVRTEVHGRTGPRASPRPFDPTICLARLKSHGWALMPHGADRVIPQEIPGAGAPLWRRLPSDLREQFEEHRAELKAYVLSRESERGKAVALRA